MPHARAAEVLAGRVRDAEVADYEVALNHAKGEPAGLKWGGITEVEDELAVATVVHGAVGERGAEWLVTGAVS
jgi:hypothetical protein